jgi:gentisate 1,2-dioxygenase
MGSATSKTTVTNGESDKMKTFLNGLPSKNLEPLWSKMSAMVPASPNPSAVPAIWKYQDMLPDLRTAAKLVPEEQAERRVLMLVNPEMGEYDELANLMIQFKGLSCIFLEPHLTRG